MSLVGKAPRKLNRAKVAIEKLREQTKESFIDVVEMVNELYEAVSREIVPVLVDVRAEVNKIAGDTTFMQDDADYSITLNERRVVCSNTIGVTVYLPTAESASGQVFTVYRAGAAVTLSAQTGETIDGALTASIGANSGIEVFSDGTRYLSA